MHRPADKILSYNLFGESTHLPDVMHCETIAARSVLHDWKIAPHRHGRLHQVMLVETGGGTAHLEGTAIALKPMSLLNLPPASVHGFAFTKGTQGYVVTLPDDLVEELLSAAGDMRVHLRYARLVPAIAETRRTIARIWREFNGRSPGRALVLRGLCATLLGLTARAIARASTDRDAHEAPLLRRFAALLETHYLDHWKVSDYARALGVTPTHLSRVARGATGEPIARLIAARLMREARRNLAYTSMNVTTVAYALNFTDPGYFSRAFSRAVGVSPRTFRQRLAERADSSGR